MTLVVNIMEGVAIITVLIMDTCQRRISDIVLVIHFIRGDIPRHTTSKMEGFNYKGEWVYT